MKLIDIIDNIENIDEELIIFQEDRNNYKTDIILSHGEESNENFKIENGKKYYYLIEVFLAKEFIEDWQRNLDYVASRDEISKRLYDYAINDA